jgi:hypothetical protein
MRHLESLHRYGTDTSKICLIALALKDCLLSQLDPILFFELAYHALEELQLIFLLDHFGVHFDDNFFFDSLLKQSVACNLSEQLEGFDTSPLKTNVKEVIAVSQLSFFAGIKASPIFMVHEQYFLQTLDSPLVDPAENYCFESLVLQNNLVKNPHLPFYRVSSI